MSFRYNTPWSVFPALWSESVVSGVLWSRACCVIPLSTVGIWLLLKLASFLHRPVAPSQLEVGLFPFRLLCSLCQLDLVNLPSCARHILLRQQTLLLQAAETSALLHWIRNYYSPSDIGQLISKDFGSIFKGLELVLGRGGLAWSSARLRCFISQQSPKCKRFALQRVALDKLIPAPGHEAIFCKF